MHKLRATITWEYNADPANYGTDDIQRIAEIDEANDYTVMLEFTCESDAATFTVEPA